MQAGNVHICFESCIELSWVCVHKIISAARGRVYGIKGVQVATRFTSSTEVSTYSRPVSQLRLIQHKQEAYWFYRFLSIVYDHIVNPGHWTEDMRDDALIPAQLSRNDLKVPLGIIIPPPSSFTPMLLWQSCFDWRYLYYSKKQSRHYRVVLPCAHQVHLL